MPVEKDVEVRQHSREVESSGSDDKFSKLKVKKGKIVGLISKEKKIKKINLWKDFDSNTRLLRIASAVNHYNKNETFVAKSIVDFLSHMPRTLISPNSAAEVLSSSDRYYIVYDEDDSYDLEDIKGVFVLDARNKLIKSFVLRTSYNTLTTVKTVIRLIAVTYDYLQDAQLKIILKSTDADTSSFLKKLEFEEAIFAGNANIYSLPFTTIMQNDEVDEENEVFRTESDV